MANIKQFLIDNDLKQVELARFLGITEASVSKMAKGMTNPSNANLQKILDNDRGWDTASLFLKETRNDSYLREENRRLKAEVDRLLTIIERLTAVTPSSLQSGNGKASY